MQQQCEEQPVKDPNTDLQSKTVVNTNIIEDQQADENSDGEDNIVPVMIRPGHIRFTSSAKGLAAFTFVFQNMPHAQSLYALVGVCVLLLILL